MSTVNNSEIYQLIEQARREQKQDNIRLETKFDGLVEGRVARMEEEVTALRVAIATAGTKLAIIGFISASIVGALISVVVPRMIK